MRKADAVIGRIGVTLSDTVLMNIKRFRFKIGWLCARFARVDWQLFAVQSTLACKDATG